MLSPKELGEAGDAVAAVYTQMEAEMLDHLVSSLVNGSITDKTLLELNLLAQANKRAVEQIIESYRDQIGEAVVQTVEEYIGKSDADDAKRIGSSEMAAPRQIVATVAGIQEILDRDNLAMAQGAKDAFLQSSIEAVTKVNSGLYTDSKAIHAAVRRLEGDGIEIITYRNAETGMVTVRNKVDVAVRRHVRTQIAQDAARMSLERMDELEVKLVEVSSHDDARPSHAEWQGRCYSLQGAIKIGTTTYPDFYEATRYGSVDGLAGANCRHSFGPYVHGAPRTYSPNPKSPTGLSGQELYELEQRQRHGERQIRAAKRQLRGAQAEYDADPTLANKANLLKAQKALRGRQESMRNLIDSANAKCKPGTHALSRNPRREWAGDMPKITKVSASQRSVSQFLDSKSVKSQMKSAGISKTRMRAEIASEMAKRGGTSKDFGALTAKEQQEMFKAALTRRKPSPTEARRANIKPVNEQLYASQKNYIERHGGIVVRGGEEVERHLDANNADAAQIGGIVMFRQTPTTSEVLEETYHFKQEESGRFAEYQVDEMRLMREIEAQEWLISVAGRYNIPIDETEATKANLECYLADLDKLKGIKND